MTALALHPVEAAAGCDLFEEGAAPFALFVGRPEAPVPVEVVTGRAEAAAVPRLWEAMDAAYRQSGGTFWLLARQRLWRGAREVRCPHAEAVDAREMLHWRRLVSGRIVGTWRKRSVHCGCSW